MKRLIIAVTVLAAPALAQQGPPPAAAPQNFGPKPPPQPQPTDPNRPEPKRSPGWMYRGMVAIDRELALATEIDTPVTGFGNEALWDAPQPAAPAPVVATRAKRR